MELIKTLEELCNIGGISGDESAAAEYIISKIDGKCEWRLDPLGNVLAFKKGANKAPHKLMLSAHMDEVGMIVTYINSDGSLCFDTVGGIDIRILYGKRVFVGSGRIPGVIGAKALHLLSDSEKESCSLSDMTIDIGCRNADDALKLVSLGDSVVFDSQFTIFGNNRICSKAIDDRAGCAVMLALMDMPLKYDMQFAFVTQEEVGLRGAQAAAYSADPEFAIVLESTTASDIPCCADEKRVCSLGGGPVISYMDRRTIYDKELYAKAFETAKELGIPAQTKTLIAGGNDAGAISVSRGGVRTIALSLPCRYLHSPSCVIDIADLENTLKLTKKFAERIMEL